MGISKKDLNECREWIAQNGPINENTTPAVLLYHEDFLVGVSDLTMEERGQYITLLCLQNSKGHLSMDLIVRTVPQVSEYVLEKFKRDESGLYYNERMEYEIYRRVRKKKTLASNLQSQGGKRSDWPEFTKSDQKAYQKERQMEALMERQKGDQKARLMETETETETETYNNINKKEKRSGLIGWPGMEARG